jgi:hypothetical protein
MICKIFRYLPPEVLTECEEQVEETEITCQDWDIDEYGETNNCELELHNGLPWDTLKLGRLSIGEENAVSNRKIYGLASEQSYEITVTLKALMTESIPFFTEEFNLIVTIGNTTDELQTVKIFSNDDEYITSNFSLTSDADGQINLLLSATSANFQVDSIQGVCGTTP